MGPNSAFLQKNRDFLQLFQLSVPPARRWVSCCPTAVTCSRCQSLGLLQSNYKLVLLPLR